MRNNPSAQPRSPPGRGSVADRRGISGGLGLALVSLGNVIVFARLPRRRAAVSSALPAE